MDEGWPALRVLAATVFVNLGLAGSVGAFASEYWLRGGASSWSARAHRRSQTALTAFLAATIVADVVLLWAQAAYMADVALAQALAVLLSMLAQTYAGRAWSVGVTGLVLAFAVAGRWVSLKATTATAFIAAGLTLFIYCRTAVSHAGDFGLASLQVLVEFTHLWAISLWLGCVSIGVLVLRFPTGSTPADRTDLGAWVKSLSAAATWALSLIFGTGLFNTWRSVGTTANLLTTSYGNVLLVKSALVALAVCLGGLNRFRTMPRLLDSLRNPQQGSPAPLQHFVSVLTVEAGVLLAALIAAVVLSSSPLPVLVRS